MSWDCPKPCWISARSYQAVSPWLNFTAVSLWLPLFASFIYLLITRLPGRLLYGNRDVKLFIQLAAGVFALILDKGTGVSLDKSLTICVRYVKGGNAEK